MIGTEGEMARAEAGGSTALLRLLATTDLHAAIRDYDYGSRRPDPSRGLSLAASLARELGAAADCAFLLDNGDFLHGESNLAVPEAGVSGVIGAMNAAGFDAAALGNHEFDAGLALLDRAMALAAFPVLCANVLRPDGSTYAAPHAMIEREVVARDGARHPVRIGVVGLLPAAAVGRAGRAKLGPLRVEDPVAVSRRVVPDLRAAGADLVLALCHGGLDEGGDMTAIALAKSGLFDAMVLGHTHGLFPRPGPRRADGVDPAAGTVGGVPAVMPGVFGRYLGRIDLHLERTEGGWRRLRHEIALHPVSRWAEAGRIEPLAPCDPAVLRASRGFHRDALLAGAREVGRISTPLSTHFSRLGRCRATSFVAGAKRLAVERVLGTEVPVVGLTAPTWCGGRGGPMHYVDIAPERIVEADLRRLCPFSDRIVALRATGADLRLWLERSVSALAQLSPGELTTRMVDPRFPPMDFDLPDRVRFRVDAGRAALFDMQGRRLREGPGRVGDLTLDGRPLDERAPLVLAVTDYRMRGGGGFPIPPGPPLVETGLTARDAVIAALAAGRGAPEDPRIFDLGPVRHATALFRTGPGAARHHDLVADLGLERLGWNAQGFRTYLVHFADPLERAGRVA